MATRTSTPPLIDFSDENDSSQQARQQKTEANDTIQIKESIRTLVQTIPTIPQTHNPKLYTIVISHIGEVVLASQQHEKMLRDFFQVAPINTYFNDYLVSKTLTAIKIKGDAGDLFFRYKRFITTLLHYYFRYSDNWLVTEIKPLADLQAFNLLVQQFSSPLTFKDKLLVKPFKGSTEDAIQEVMWFKSDTQLPVFTILTDFKRIAFFNASNPFCPQYIPSQEELFHDLIPLNPLRISEAQLTNLGVKIGRYNNKSTNIHWWKLGYKSHVAYIHVLFMYIAYFSSLKDIFEEEV